MLPFLPPDGEPLRLYNNPSPLGQGRPDERAITDTTLLSDAPHVLAHGSCREWFAWNVPITGVFWLGTVGERLDQRCPSRIRKLRGVLEAIEGLDKFE